MQEFYSLSKGNSAELEWEDKITSPDQFTIELAFIKSGLPDLAIVLVEGSDKINGRKIGQIFRGEMPILTRGANSIKIFKTMKRLMISAGIAAVKLTYWGYESLTPQSNPMSSGDLWIKDW